MNKKIIFILIIISLILTFSTLFIKIVPCKSWYGSNTGVEDLAPHNTICNIFYGVGAHNEYYYLTTDPSVAFLMTFAIFLIIVFLIKLFIIKYKK